MDEILIAAFNADAVLKNKIANKKLMPDHIDEASGYPAIAYTLDGNVVSCAKGIGNENHGLTFIIEAKSKREAVEVKKDVIRVFGGIKYISLLGYMDSFERTSKTNQIFVNFKIVKTT